MEEILKIEKIEKCYGNKSNLTKAIDNISFSVIRESLLLLWEQVVVAKQHFLIVFLL